MVHKPKLQTNTYKFIFGSHLTQEDKYEGILQSLLGEILLVIGTQSPAKGHVVKFKVMDGEAQLIHGNARLMSIEPLDETRNEFKFRIIEIDQILLDKLKEKFSVRQNDIDTWKNLIRDND